MKTTETPIQKEFFQRKFEEIVKLYAYSPLQDLFNDMVAIGTWPTPEKPKKVTKGSIAIDSVPLPEKPEKLKQLIKELIEIAKNRPLGLILKD